MAEKIMIKDSKRKQQKIIDSTHPFYKEVKNSLMPDEFRIKQKKISNMSDEIIEEAIKDYYEQLEAPYGNSELSNKLKIAIFLPLTPTGIMYD